MQSNNINLEITRIIINKEEKIFNIVLGTIFFILPNILHNENDFIKYNCVQYYRTLTVNTIL